MHWHLGGNFAPVQMICQVDWRECPGALANYVWCEVVTDVLDFLAKDGLEWRVPAILVVGIFLLHLVYNKSRSCCMLSLPDREIIGEVDSRVQDLELKVNILTYKLQYDTWPLPHQIQGTLVKRDDRNFGLSLPEPNHHDDWTSNLTLRRHQIIPQCKVSHVIDWKNVKERTYGQSLKRASAKHSNSSSDRSLEYNSERQRKHSIHLEGIGKLSKSEDLQAYHGEMSQFLTNARRNCGRLSYKDRIARDLSFYRRCYEFRAYERFTKTLEDCKFFLRELHNSNRNLGLVYSSSELTVSSHTNTDFRIEPQKDRKRRKKWKKHPHPEESVREICEEVEDREETLKSANEIEGKSIVRTSSITNLTTPKFVDATTNVPCPKSITNEYFDEASIAIARNKTEQNSEQTLQEVRKKLESLYYVLQTLDVQVPTLREMEAKEEHESETLQDSPVGFEFVTEEINYLTDGSLEESRVDVMISSHSLNDRPLESNSDPEAKSEECDSISCIYKMEPNRNNEEGHDVASVVLKSNTKGSNELSKKKLILQKAGPTPVDTEDDGTVASTNSTKSDVSEAISEGVVHSNSLQNIENKPNFCLGANMPSDPQPTYLDIIAEEQSTCSSSERMSACPSHLTMDKQTTDHEKTQPASDESLLSKPPIEKCSLDDPNNISVSSENDLTEQPLNIDASDMKKNTYDTETLETNTAHRQNNEIPALSLGGNTSECLTLKRNPGMFSLVESNSVDEQRTEEVSSPKEEVPVGPAEVCDNIDNDAPEMPEEIGSSANRPSVNTSCELKYSRMHENKSEHADESVEFAQDRSCRLEHLLAVNKWCLDQQERNTIYNIEYNLHTTVNSHDVICLKDESSSLNTTSVSSVLEDAKPSDDCLTKNTVLQKNKLSPTRQKAANPHIDAARTKMKRSASFNYGRQKMHSNEKEEIDIGSIDSTTNSNTTELISLGPGNSSEDDLHGLVKRPASSKGPKSSAKRNTEVSKRQKASTTKESVKSSPNSATKSKVRSNLTCARVRCSSAESESNRSLGKTMHPKRSRSECAENRNGTQLQQVPVEGKVHARSPPSSITSASKIFSKSSIPVLKSRLDSTRRTESETSPRCAVKEILPTSMSWKNNAKTSSITHEVTAIQKNPQCMGEVKHPLPKSNEADRGKEDTKIKQPDCTEFNPRTNNIMELSNRQAAIYVKIFTRDSKKTTGLMNPNKFLEYIKGKDVNCQRSFAGNQSATSENNNTKVLSLLTNAQDYDGSKIIATTSSLNPTTLNDLSSQSVPNFYFLSIVQKDASSLEISLSVQNMERASEGSESVLKKFQAGTPKELNNDEYVTLIEVLHKAQNHLYLQEVYDLCKTIISGHPNFS